MWVLITSAKYILETWGRNWNCFDKGQKGEIRNFISTILFDRSSETMARPTIMTIFQTKCFKFTSAMILYLRTTDFSPKHKIYCVEFCHNKFGSILRSKTLVQCLCLLKKVLGSKNVLHLVFTKH